MSLQELRGEHAVIEWYRDGATICYRFYGAGIAEQVGTSKLPEVDLFEVLLVPCGLRVAGGRIVSAAWGGAREGAGRPPLDATESAMRSTITLPPALDDKALRLGNGNRSEGIRKALAAFVE